MLPKVKENALFLLLGGSGSRFGGCLPKQFISLEYNLLYNRQSPVSVSRPLFAHTAHRLLSSLHFSYVVLVVGEDFISNEIFLSPVQKLKEEFPQISFLLARGGSSRHQSFRSAWFTLREKFAEQKNDAMEIGIAVHDANRPHLSDEFLRRIGEKLNLLSRQTPCYIPTLAAVDSMLQTDKYGHVLAYLNRDFIFRAQTPQLLYAPALLQKLSLEHNREAKKMPLKFSPAPLELAHNAQTRHQPTADFSDEGSMMLYFGFRVLQFDGEAQNIKITFQGDMANV